MTVDNATFLKAVFGDDFEQAHVTGFADDPSNIPDSRHLIAWRGGYFAQYPLQPGTNQYFTISTFHPDENGTARRRKALFKATHAVVLDDVGEKLSESQAQRLPPPSWILETSPGSEQHGYILAAPCGDRPRVENLLDGLVRCELLAPDGKDPGMKGATRYMRLPEGVNNKASKMIGGQPFKCRLKVWRPTRRYTLEQLAQPFEIDLDAPRRETRADGAAHVDGHPLLDVPELVRVKDIRSDGRYDVTCPWVDEHTGAADSGSAVFTNADGSLGFKCHHGACQGRTGRDLLAWLEERSPGFGTRLAGWKASRMLADVSEVSFLEAPAQAAQAPAAPLETMLEEIDRAEWESDEQIRLAKNLLRLVEDLPKPNQLQWHRRIVDKTPWTMQHLKECLKEFRAEWYGDEDEFDHLQLAGRIIDELGSENIIGDAAGLWSWHSAGVWRKAEERAVRQMVQKRLARMISKVNVSTVNGVTDLLRNEVYAPGHEWNIGPAEAVNVLNGELELSGGGWALKPHCRDNYRTVQVPVTYDSNARCPRFEQFLCEVFAGDEDGNEKRRAVLEMMGYSLMAHTKYELMVMLVGSGSNGKSVLMKIMRLLAGKDNAAAVQPGNFGSMFQRASLAGKLVNIVTEMREGEVVDDAAFKAIVSGEPMAVERKFGDPFTMTPYATCWIGTNHMPHTRDFSNGLFRRVLVMPFNNTFKPELGNCDPDLEEKLKGELPGILNACLNAYAQAVKVGFTIPASTLEARKQWRLDADQVAQFLEECMETSPGGEVAFSLLYDRFKVWASQNGIKAAVKSRKFGERLDLLGYTTKRGAGGIRVRCGLKFQEVV